MQALLTAPARPSKSLEGEKFTTNTLCDSCGSRSFVFAKKGSLELSFCGHHGRSFMPGLVGAGFIVLDNTYKLWEAEAAMKGFVYRPEPDNEDDDPDEMASA